MRTLFGLCVLELNQGLLDNFRIFDSNMFVWLPTLAYYGCVSSLRSTLKSLKIVAI